LATVTDPKVGTTRYAYDGAHRLIIITDAKGNIDLQNFYGPGDRLLRHIQAVGNEYRFWYTCG
jgi:YD repeat-containing protein